MTTPAGAVVCGGASRRMGRDKALVAVDGVAMAERVARALEAAGCADVRFIGGDAPALAALGRPVLPDAYPGAGPLGAVITALRASGRPVVVAACDLADLDADTVVAVVGDGIGDLPRVAHTDRLEPLLRVVATGGARVRSRRSSPPANGPCTGRSERSATSPSRSPPAGSATSTPRPTCTEWMIRPPAATRGSLA